MKNKKEPLSIMIVKTLLAVVIFTGIGTIIIGGAYLIGKQSVISLPYYQPSDKSECKIDSDCNLVFTGPYISCNSPEEYYKCFNISKDDAEEINRGIKRLDAACPDKSSKYVCECENRKCEKIKEELVEEVSITTDKMEYEQGENVKVTVKNNLGEDIQTHKVSVEKLNSAEWEEIMFDVRCSCLAGCSSVDIILLPDNSRKFIWDQNSNDCKKVIEGIYRFKINLTVQGDKIIYSNEFTIKEKSALDLKCSEKVVGIGLCEAMGIGYEFNSETGKCIKRGVSGCSIETPFKTLEECQEVCEKKEGVVFPNEDELIKCESDNDCVLVDPEVCDCDICKMKAINRKYADVWNNQACVLKVFCTEVMISCVPHKAECDDNKCIAVEK